MITCSNLVVNGDVLSGHINNTSVGEECNFEVSLSSDHCLCDNPTYSLLKNIATLRSVCIRNKNKIGTTYEICYG